jgi:ribosomal protein S12 methylthiotransferase accessory factor
MSMRIVFPGGKRVDAFYKGFAIRTDQPESVGGENSAPSPFDLFLASLGTCAGYYVLAFCQRKSLPTGEVTLTLSAVRDEAAHRMTSIEIHIALPSDFPMEYVEACAQAAKQCAVKSHLQDALRVDITARRGQPHAESEHP